MKLEGTTSLVTGASTGIGQAIAEAIGKQRGRVAVVGRNSDGLRKTARLVEEAGGQALTLSADLRNERDITELAETVATQCGTVDVLANVAAVWHDEKTAFFDRQLVDTPVQQIDDVFNVGLRAPILLTRLLLPNMIRKRQGKILNISGTFASGGAGWLHYYVSKKALEQFTIGLADELRQHEIQVNCISPSDVATESLRRFFPEDAQTALAPSSVAEAAMFLIASDVADHVTGQVLVVKSKAAY